MAPLDYAGLLREHGLRATPGRIQLLKVLAAEKKPVTIEELRHRLGGSLDTATLYRALEALRETHLVERMDLQHGHAHYEIRAGRPHHHHAVCRSCGTVEDLEIPHAAEPEKEAARRAKTFSVIDAYSLEFFGLCTQCA